MAILYKGVSRFVVHRIIDLLCKVVVESLRNASVNHLEPTTSPREVSFRRVESRRVYLQLLQKIVIIIIIIAITP